MNQRNCVLMNVVMVDFFSQYGLGNYLWILLLWNKLSSTEIDTPLDLTYQLQEAGWFCSCYHDNVSQRVSNSPVFVRDHFNFKKTRLKY